MDELIARVEATIHCINGHWWNKRARPEAPDLCALLDRISTEPERIAVAVGEERERLLSLVQERHANYSGMRDQAVEVGLNENGYALATEALERVMHEATAIREGSGV